MPRERKIAILIPCYNEEQGIGQVLDSIPHKSLYNRGYSAQAIVIDNNCTDRTAIIAKDKKALVVKENMQGKGHALLTGLRQIGSADIVAMIDGDSSYDITEIIRLIEILDSGFGDVAVGSRLHGRTTISNMKPLNRLGNWIFTFLARVGYGTNVTDTCSGFFVWKRDVVDKLREHLVSDGFSIEMEIIAKMARLGFSCFSVPISYKARAGKSSLRPFRDGYLILRTWFKYLHWQPKSFKGYILKKDRPRVYFSDYKL